MRKLFRRACCGAAFICATTLSTGPSRSESAPPPASSAEAARVQPLSSADKDFLNYAAEDNQAEIQIYLLAEKMAQSLPIKAFARLMVDDHVQIESRLAALIGGVGVRVSNGVGEDGAKTLSYLGGLNGAAFDHAFLEAQISDHGNDIKKLGAQATSTGNSGIRNFASETIALLQQHLELAKAITQAQQF